MSGHSKWSTIKHKKAINDAKRSGVFTKLAKDITIAAREGGDPEMNFKLRMAMDKAKNANMPKENIERAVKKGTGELKDEAQIEELVYEAYGPGQVAMLIKVATDNKNRALGEIRSILNKIGGKMVEGGSVRWQFEYVGLLEVFRGEQKQEDFELELIESGAKDYREEEDVYVVATDPQELKKVRDGLEQKGIKIQNATLSYLAKETIQFDENSRESYEKLWEALNDQEDVAEVFDNLAQ